MPRNVIRDYVGLYNNVDDTNINNMNNKSPARRGRGLKARKPSIATRASYNKSSRVRDRKQSCSPNAAKKSSASVDKSNSKRSKCKRNETPEDDNPGYISRGRSRIRESMGRVYDTVSEGVSKATRCLDESWRAYKGGRRSASPKSQVSGVSTRCSRSRSVSRSRTRSRPCSSVGSGDCCTSRVRCKDHKGRGNPPYKRRRSSRRVKSQGYSYKVLMAVMALVLVWAVYGTYSNRHYIKIYGPIEFVKSISPFSAGGLFFFCDGKDTMTSVDLDTPSLLQRMTGGLVGGGAGASSQTHLVNESPPPSEGIEGQGGYITSRLPSVDCSWCTYLRSFIFKPAPKVVFPSEDRRTSYASSRASSGDVNDDLLEKAIQLQLKTKYRLAKELHSKLGVLISEVNEVKAVQKELNGKLNDNVKELRTWIDNGNKQFSNLEESAMKVKESDAAVPYYHTKQVEDMIKKSIELYSADKLGMVDYALESSGASILYDGVSNSYAKKTILHSFFYIPFWYSGNSIEYMIRPENNPGDCWAMDGTQGYITVKLSVAIMVTSVSLEHTPQSITLPGSRNSAPKDFIVLALTSAADRNPVELGAFTYIQGSSPIQNFKIKNPRKFKYPIIRLQILNNHGNPDYTCVYRFRVHSHSHTQGK